MFHRLQFLSAGVFSKLKRKLITLGILGLAAPAILGEPAPVLQDDNHGRHRLLIINSYNEDEQWANFMSQPVYQFLSQVDTVGVDMVYLNSAATTDSSIYYSVSDHVFNSYADAHPDYVVMIGNFAFTYRDRIQEEWGDIPMLLISCIRDYGPLSDYFADLNDTVVDPQRPLTSLRNQYNFTCLFMRDYTSRTVDLAYAVIPDMKKFVFMSDCAYVNKVAAYKLQSYLDDINPDIEFEWLKASPETADAIMYYMTHECPGTGFLLSSWSYETESVKGTPVFTSKDLRMLPSSVNPIFTLRAAYTAFGAIGGVYDDNEKIAAKTVEVIQAMLEGKSMHGIPFYAPDEAAPHINYELLKKYGLSEKDCPDGTIFTMKPQSYWRKYRLLILPGIGLVLVILIYLWGRLEYQRKRIATINSHADLVNKMPIPYTRVNVRLTPDGRMLEAKYDIHNLAFDEIFEKNVIQHDLMHLHTNEQIENIAGKILSTNKPQFFSTYFDATKSYLDFMVYPVRTYTKKDSTKVCVLDLFIIDNTHRYELNKKVKEYTDSLDLTIQIANLIPWQWDYTHSALTISPKFFDHSAESDQDIMMSWTDFSQLVLDEDLPLLNEQFRIVGERQSTSIHVQYRIKSDKHPQGYEWLETYAKVTEFDEEGNYVKMLGTIQNITERKSQEEKLEAAVKKANESDRLKSAFLANMSHEIRTPLNAIVGFSHLLARSSQKEEREKFVQIIDHNNDMLLTLINDVLDLAKIESNTIDLHYTVCDVNDLLDSIVKTCNARVPANVRISLVPYATKCVVEADANRVSQVVVNLLTNACKFTRKGAITVGYEVHDDKELYIYVRDTGIGVDRENQEKIFEQFVKVDDFAQGTGLGLAICRTLVERMGGEIGCTSSGLGRGSTFWFTIPYVPVHIDNEHDEVIEDKPEVSTHQLEVYEINEDTEELQVKGHPTILIGEDNPSNQWLIQHLLQKQFNLIAAKNGLEAYEIFQKRHNEIDLIIMDINMPVMDGYEAVRNIRTVSATVPIIAVTAYAFATDRERILNSGFNAFVAKPITEHSMAEALSKYLSVKPLVEDFQD